MRKCPPIATGTDAYFSGPVRRPKNQPAVTPAVGYGQCRLHFQILIFQRLTIAAVTFLLALRIAASAVEPLTETYRAARTALEAGDAAKCVALLEPRLPEASGEQRGPLLFTLGVAFLKCDRPADAERTLVEARAFFEGQPKSAETWALIGDSRDAQSRPGDAAQAYAEVTRLSASNPDSLIARYATARSAELAAAEFLLKGDPLPAIARLRAAAQASPERIPAVQARLGEIAASRKLRGEATAASIFALGEIEERANHLPEAIAYYQRVFVSWLKFPNWVARSYLRAAECFEKLGQRNAAIAHLEEMMRKLERLHEQPEFKEGNRRLREWRPPER